MFQIYLVDSLQYVVYLFFMYYGIFLFTIYVYINELYIVVCQLSIYNNFSLKDNKYLFLLIYNSCLKDIKFIYF